MANPPAKSQSKPKSAAAAKQYQAKPGAASVNSRRAFEDAHYRYMQALQEAWRDAQQSTAEIHQRQLLEHQELSTEAQKRAWEAHMAYMKALQEASAPEDVQKRRDAEKAYAEAQQDLHAEAQQRAIEVQQNCMRALQELAEKAQSQNPHEEAYRAYLEALREAWSSVEIGSIDPASLTAISHSVATVASSANGLLISQDSPAR